MDESKEPRYAPGQNPDMEAAAEPVPDLRQSPNGAGVAFGATQEPEYVTAGGPDGRSAEPDPRMGAPMLGAVTQDDPEPVEHFSRPDAGAEGDVTLIAVFEDITPAKSCAENLERRGLGAEVVMVSRRGDGPEQGERPGNVITGPGYGLSAEDQSPPRDPGMGAGVAVGATIGATVGLLAATYVHPVFGTLATTGSLLSTLAGAGIGSFLGGLTEFGTSEQQDGDDATQYAGQVRRGGVILLTRASQDEADEVRRLISVWNPLEIRVQ